MKDIYEECLIIQHRNAIRYWFPEALNLALSLKCLIFVRGIIIIIRVKSRQPSTSISVSVRTLERI